MTVAVNIVTETYVVFKATRDDDKPPHEWRWRRTASCMTREQAMDETLELGPRDGRTLHAVFAIGCYGSIQFVCTDVCKDTDPQMYALRSIPWSIPVDEAWAMLSMAASLGWLSSRAKCQPGDHHESEQRYNPWPLCEDDQCQGRCGKPYEGVKAP